MSRPQPTRPSAPAGRKPAGGVPSAAGAAARKGPSLEELRNLPMFVEDGTNIDFSSDNISSGRITDETVTIGAAKVKIQDWKKKDGTFAVRKDGSPCYPEVQLEIGLRREGDEGDGKLYQVGLKYASIGLFGPSKDGNFLKVRPNVIKEGGYPPKLRKYDPAVLFLQSIESAGPAGKAAIEKMKSEGVSALVGLRIHVREQRVNGMPEKQPDALLVDYLDGIGQVAAQVNAAPAKPKASAAPAAQKSAAPATTATAAQTETVSDDISGLAEEALVDLLTAAEGNTIVRAQIATTLIRNDKWKAHDQRGAILKRLREDDFINGGDKWVVDGTNVILA